jgi:hypothetical protein
MKKFFVVTTILLLLADKQIAAQTLSPFQLRDGTNTITLPGNNTLEFNFKGHYFSNFIFHDAAGTDHPLKTSRGTVNGVARPACRTNQMMDAYASYQKDIGVYICKPKPSPGVEATEFNMTVDMPGATGKAQNRRVELKLSK